MIRQLVSRNTSNLSILSKKYLQVKTHYSYAFKLIDNKEQTRIEVHYDFKQK